MMRTRLWWLVLVLAGAVAFVAVPACTNGQGTPFGDQEDVEFASAVWTAMGDYQGWLMRSDYRPGGSPHGDFVRLYYNIVTVDGSPYHVIVKDNFGGEDVSLETLPKEAGERLMAVTIMVQREPGYDPENHDWFWVKYAPDGSVARNDQGMRLAGKVAKGMQTGCIACHAKAGEGDYLFTNDE